MSLPPPFSGCSNLSLNRASQGFDSLSDTRRWWPMQGWGSVLPEPASAARSADAQEWGLALLGWRPRASPPPPPAPAIQGRALSHSCFRAGRRGPVRGPHRCGRVPAPAAACPHPRLLPQEGGAGLRRGRLVHPHLRLPARQHQAQQSRYGAPAPRHSCHGPHAKGHPARATLSASP